MNGERDLTPVVRVWLRTDEHESADRVLDAALDEIESIPQLRESGPLALDLGDRSALLRLALAAAFVLVLIVGAGLLARVNVGDSAPTTPPVPSILPAQRTPMDPGSYLIAQPFPVQVTFDLAGVWHSYGTRANVAGIYRGSDYDIGLGFWIVDNLPVDGCSPEAGDLDPPVGPGVNDLATAFAERPGYVVVGPVDVTLGGHAGQYLELTGEGSPRCFSSETWTVPASPLPETRVSLPREVDRIWIIDVNGTRVVVDAFRLPDVDATEQAELDAIVQTIRFEPSPSSE